MSRETVERGGAASAFRRFLAYYRGQGPLFWVDTLCAVALAAVGLAFPQLLRFLTSGLFADGADVIDVALLYLACGMVGMYSIQFLSRYFVTYWGHVMGARMESRMREDLFDAYERMSFSFYDRNKSGDLMSRLVSDLFDISEAAHHGPEYLVIGLIEVVGSFAILGTINVPLTCVLAAILVALVVFDVYANNRMEDAFTENRVRISQVNSRLEDSLVGYGVVKSFAAEDLEREKFRAANDAYLDSRVRVCRAMGLYQAAIDLMMGALYSAIVVFGGWLVARGQMTATDLATYALYISLFTSPIRSILDFTETFQKSIAGFRRFLQVIDTVPDVLDADGARDLELAGGSVSYEGVCFSYDEGGEVLHDLELDIEPGRTVALVGPSGGGKSTICSLLPRFYDVARGRILVDGQDVRQVTQRSLRQAIGMVQQDVYLFDGTVAENIAYGCPGASAERVREAAVAANADGFISELPNGYDTQVGERGARLSGGQKQRIAIARVFLKNPPILILDEATSALDNESERAVQDSLERLSHGRTTLVIAHRLSTIKGADEIVTIQDGRVAERGSHDELLARNGTYARYYRMQFRGERD